MFKDNQDCILQTQFISYFLSAAVSFAVQSENFAPKWLWIFIVFLVQWEFHIDDNESDTIADG